MPVVRVNGVGLNVMGTGRGSDVVMVHGLAASLAFWWFTVIPSLRDRFHITAFDLRGHGKSEMPETGYTTAHCVADLEALLESLGVDRVHLVGHSFGGDVALHMACRHPERVRSLTLADARLRCVQPVNRLDDWPNRDQIRRELRRAEVDLAENEEEAGQRLLEALAVGGRYSLVQRLGGDSEGVQRGFGAWGSRGAAQWLRLLATTTARADFCAPSDLSLHEIEGITTPILAVYGEWSPCLPSLRGLKRLLPTSRIVMAKNAGHFHPVTRPATFVAALDSFLNYVDGTDMRLMRPRGSQVLRRHAIIGPNAVPPSIPRPRQMRGR